MGVNGEYEKTPAGAQLEHHDNMIRYRGRVREASLAMRNRLGFNPIIGEQTFGISLPPAPRPHRLHLHNDLVVHVWQWCSWIDLLSKVVCGPWRSIREPYTCRAIEHFVLKEFDDL